jgi:sugar transferase (PEP-CTERM/EpsH1 system associated)
MELIESIESRSRRRVGKKTASIKVMHIIEDLENGGAERVLVTLVSGLAPQRFRPLVCCLTKKGRMAAELEARGIPVVTMNKQPKLDLAMLFRLRKLMREQKIDIVHTHVFTANFWGRLAAIFANVPVLITHEHSTFTVDNRYRRWIETVLIRRTNKVITVSENLRNRLVSEGGLPPSVIMAIHNGLRLQPQSANEARRAQLRRELGLEKFDHVIGTVGRLEPRKNYPLLLEAMATLLARHPRTALLMVGSGPEEEKLQQQAHNLGINQQVVFTGYRSDISDLLGLMSTFCLSSITEGISMAILEAMAAGVPVVATQVGGNAEIIPDREHGMLVPSGDVAALANALSETLSNRDAAIKIAKNGQKRVCEFFSERHMIQRIEGLYMQCMAQTNRFAFFETSSK